MQYHIIMVWNIEKYEIKILKYVEKIINFININYILITDKNEWIYKLEVILYVKYILSWDVIRVNAT